MNEVTKMQFKEMYFTYGTEESGWGLEYWNRSFGVEPSRNMRYLVELPQSPDHSRMMIVTDFSKNEYRMFFNTEENEGRFFG